MTRSTAKLKYKTSRASSLIPNADAIAEACGVDKERAEIIQSQLGDLLEIVVDIIAGQTELIAGQAKTAKLVDKQLDQERDAKKTREDVLKFLSGDPIPVDHVLKTVFTDFWQTEFGKLEHGIKIELFATLSKAIMSLEDLEHE